MEKSITQHQKNKISRWIKILLPMMLLVFLVYDAGLCRNVSGQAQKDHGISSAQVPASNPVISSLTKKERAWLSDHPVIRIVQDSGWPPIEFADEQGRPAGMANDYVKLVEQRLGIKFQQVHSLSWQESYARLKRWEIDMTTSVAVTPERNEFWAFTRPYMKIPIVIIARTDVTFIADMRELSGKKVAVVDGYAAADWIPRDFPDIHLVKVKTVKEGIDLLQKEEAFAFVENMLVIGYYMAKLKMMNLKIAGETPYINAQCMAVRKDWEILAGILQKALDSISETERSNIYKKWLPVRYEHGFNYSLLWQALAIFAAILLALVVWIKKLSGEIRHRKEAEAALSNSEERLRTTLDNMIEGGQIISFDWKYLYVNDSAILHGRMTREKLLGKTLMEAYPGIEKTEVFTRLKECMENRVNLRMDNEFIYSDGSSGWFRLSIQPVPEGIFVLSENITEQKRATEALRKAHARLRCFVDANIVGIVIASQSGVVIEANDYYLGLIGYTREEFEQGMVNWRAITPPEWFYADDHAIEELRERGTCTPYEKEYIRRDGTRVSVFLSDAMLPGPEEHIAAFVLDITDRKKAEERQKISEDKYRNIFENAVEGIFQTTIQGQFLSANPAMAKMIGYDSPAELISSINDIKEQLYVNPEDRATLINVLKEKNAVEGFELHQRRRDGSSFWALVNVRAVMDEAGNILYLEGTHEDITHRKLAEEELKQTMEKLRKSLSGIIQVISLTVETRDPYTAGHQKRVSNLAGAIAQKIGLQKDVIDNICTAGIIHDIGKISIPAEILSKPGTLTDIEFSLIKSHSQSGYDILKNVELPYPIAEIVLQHHERLDGSGYPRGLKGEEILLQSRIISLADVVEAIASHRPYRPARGIDAALDEIEKNKDILYDARAVEACLKLFREKGFAFEPIES